MNWTSWAVAILLISGFHVVTSLSSPNAVLTRNMVLKRNWLEIRYVDLDCFLLGLSQQIYRRWVIWIYRNAWPVMIAILFKIWNLILVHQEKRVEKMIESGRIPRYFWSINLQDLNTRSACPDSIPVHPSSGRLWDVELVRCGKNTSSWAWHIMIIREEWL